MGSIKPDGDRADTYDSISGFCTMYVSNGYLHFRFEEQTDHIQFGFEEVEMLYDSVGNALEVMRNEIQDKTTNNTAGSTDT